MNNLGDVVAGVGENAFLFGEGKKTPLTFLSPKFHNAQPQAINDAGQISGTLTGRRIGKGLLVRDDFFGDSYLSFRLPDAFVYDGRRFRNVGPGSATGITESGDVAGLAIWPHGPSGWAVKGAFISKASHRRTLRLPPHVRAKDIVAAAIDSAGDVIVAADYVYMYSKHSRKAEQIAPMHFESAAINRAGQVAGVVSTVDPAHSYIVGQGQTIDLGPVDPRIVTRW